MRKLWGSLAVLLTTATVLVLGPTSTACACSCAEPNATRSLEWADLAFMGVVVDVDRPLLNDGSGELVARLKVESVTKGTAGDEVEIRTSVEGPSCGFDFVEGNRYLVFSQDGHTDLCAGNQLLGPAPEVPLASDVPYGVLTATGAGVLIVALTAWLLLRRRRGPAAQRQEDQDSA
ncbi:hypothetical protein Cs7R123_39980 [Catellatospora sp. TT07R-123]|uniref:hypothetical protein n=1 Tax=Catellatospora sp. TT07R-123 TaxID=2733863 RepID=UPI001B031C2F|nr:hypothetical protein [Catellatospora sp. TT07R-123]GHJ46656.1 hypothetical protein Cs7R123_39980 [Catellatospora sp. TT07R-123]